MLGENNHPDSVSGVAPVKVFCFFPLIGTGLLKLPTWYFNFILDLSSNYLSFSCILDIFLICQFLPQFYTMQTPAHILSFVCFVAWLLTAFIFICVVTLALLQ